MFYLFYLIRITNDIQSVNINVCALLTIINNTYIILTFKYKLIPHDENYHFKS